MSTLRTDNLETTDSKYSISVRDLLTGGTGSRTVGTISELKALSTLTNKRVIVAGYYTAGDSGLRVYYVPTTVTGLVADGGSVIRADDGGWFVLATDGVFNVAHFGAKGDFATDNSVAIQNAINAAGKYAKTNGTALRGGVVEFPAGIFNIGTGLVINDAQVTLRGAGKYSTMLRPTATTMVGVYVNGANTTIRDLEVSCAGAGISASSVSIYVNASNCTIDNFVVGGSYVGLRLANGSGGRYSNFDMNDCVSAGVLIRGDNAQVFQNDSFFSNFLVINSDQTKFALGGIRIEGRAEAMMFKTGDLIGSVYPVAVDPAGTIGFRYSTFDSVFFDSGKNQALFDTLYNVRFVNCWASGGREGNKPGISIANSKKVSWVGGMCFSSGSDGMYLLNCSEVSISDSDFTANAAGTGAAGNGLAIVGCSNVSVSNCTGSADTPNRQVNGLFIDSTSSNVTLTGNGFTGNKTANYLIGTASVDMFGNRNLKTSNKGTGVLPASATSVTVPHGLTDAGGRNVTLASISITANGAVASPMYVASVNATNFVVAVLNANTGATGFSWQAEV
ncbi:hypothetical protein phiB1_1_43 [Pseudomonas phage phiB1_1]|uniref:Uncharacterized protein n=1 Tax=Pseudomonas phage phiB1_1 TaxID=2755402 RepID=A0A7D7K064_9CAUD|nr:hypothetical protein phiB1_1_43 [Pseudomonas phage phiB1_1]UAW53684.1 hypothetical protein pphageB21_51 [Pseudomonas phage pphageB21]UAW53743.1 hypothetical protein pphageT21_51 [Pseudomonas phage pphageT21]UAW53862.1 hypothetical protein pphageBV72_50 [Pseudomonas phage pphageBV72]